MLWRQPAQCHTGSDAQQRQRIGRQAGTREHLPAIVKADEEPVKQCIQRRQQQKTVEGVQPLGIAGALDPRFGVAGAECLGPATPVTAQEAAPQKEQKDAVVARGKACDKVGR